LSVEDPADLAFIMASKDALAWDFVGIPSSQNEGVVTGGETRVTFWLEKEAESKAREIREALLKMKSDEQYGEYGEDADFGRLWLDTEVVFDDWKHKYKESFRAFSPCEGILIVPPWDMEACGDGSAIIVIDPGMAFGTGSHETTAMCLARLRSLILPGDIVLDAGTGSGILAIAAALLGAARVFAVEIDPDAAESASRNIKANGAAETITLITGDIAAEGVLPAGVKFDLITANLTCALHEALLPVFKAILKDGGTMLLSGLLDIQEDRALEALENERLGVIEVIKKGEWLMIEVRK